MNEENELYSIKSSHENSAPFQFILGQLKSIRLVYIKLTKDSLALIDAKQKELDEELNKLSKKDNDEADIFYQHDYEYGRIQNLEMKDALLNSSVIYLYSHIEKALFEVVRICEEKLDYISFNSYTDKCKKYRKGIWKAIKYIELSSKCSFQDIIDEWIEIDFLRQIRNRIVHRIGILYKNEEKLKEYISSQGTLELFDIKMAGNKIVEHQIIIKKEYIEYISSHSVNYLNKITKRIWELHFS